VLDGFASSGRRIVEAELRAPNKTVAPRADTGRLILEARVPQEIGQPELGDGGASESRKGSCGMYPYDGHIAASPGRWPNARVLVRLGRANVSGREVVGVPAQGVASRRPFAAT
jgi:hypothetical protein